MIRKLSKKRAKQNRDYIKFRNQFLRDNPICQVEGCGCEATETHHMKGRVGKLLTDVRYFLAVCRSHHNYIELHPVEAKEQGYSLNRLA